MSGFENLTVIKGLITNQFFLRIDIIYDFFEKRTDFNYKYIISKMSQHSSPFWTNPLIILPWRPMV